MTKNSRFWFITYLFGSQWKSKPMLLHNDCPVVALYTQTEAFYADIVRTRQSSVSAKLTNTIHMVEWRKISDPKAHSLFLSLSSLYTYICLPSHPAHKIPCVSRFTQRVNVGRAQRPHNRCVPYDDDIVAQCNLVGRTKRHRYVWMAIHYLQILFLCCLSWMRLLSEANINMLFMIWHFGVFLYFYSM